MAHTAAPHLVVAAGGTGGHMFPAQALAEAMLRRGWKVTLSTDARGARYADGFPDAVERRIAASATFARGGPWARAAVPFRILTGVAIATLRALRDRPDAVVGFGGYPSIPAMAAARIARVPSMLHEQNGVLGRVNRVFARRVDVVACGAWPVALPGGVTGVHTGNPVRAAIAERAGAPYTPPGGGRTTLLVFGGSQGARVLSDVVPAAVASLPEGLRHHLHVAHQARPEDSARVADAYGRGGLQVDVAPFFHDMARRLAAAQLAICRSGASSVADVCAVGRPAIYIPLAAALRDEQTANARGPVEAGAAISIPERELTPQTLRDAIETILGQPARAERMARAALSASIPDAADRLAALVEGLAGKGSP